METKEQLKQKWDDYVEKESFQVPYNGTTEFYSKDMLMAFKKAWEWIESNGLINSNYSESYAVKRYKAAEKLLFLHDQFYDPEISPKWDEIKSEWELLVKNEPENIN